MRDASERLYLHSVDLQVLPPELCHDLHSKYPLLRFHTSVKSIFPLKKARLENSPGSAILVPYMGYEIKRNVTSQLNLTKHEPGFSPELAGEKL